MERKCFLWSIDGQEHDLVAVILNEGWNRPDDALLEAAGLLHIMKGGMTRLSRRFIKGSCQ
jgi:hypothetical protein